MRKKAIEKKPTKYWLYAMRIELPEINCDGFSLEIFYLDGQTRHRDVRHCRFVEIDNLAYQVRIRPFDDVSCGVMALNQEASCVVQ